MLTFKWDTDSLSDCLANYFAELKNILKSSNYPNNIDSIQLLNYVIAKISYDFYCSFNCGDFLASEIIGMQDEFVKNLQKDLRFIERYDFKNN